VFQTLFQTFTFIKLHLRVEKRTDTFKARWYLDGTQLAMAGRGRVGSVGYQAKLDQVGMAGL
jgi:hypothetical protein